MKFIANTLQVNLGRNERERNAFSEESSRARQMLRQMRGEPEADYIVQVKGSLRRLLKDGGEKVAVIVGEGFVADGSAGSIYFYLANSSYRNTKVSPSIAEVEDMLLSEGYEVGFLFLILEEREYDRFLRLGDFVSGLSILLGRAIDRRYMYSLAVEFSSWSRVLNLEGRPPSILELEEALETMLRRLSATLPSARSPLETSFRRSNRLQMVSPEVRLPDYALNLEKIRQGRPEQKLDELNRLAQLACSEDSNTRCQASFWYFSLSDQLAAQYPCLMMFFRLVANCGLEEAQSEALLRANSTSECTAGKEFLIELLDSFIFIQGGPFWMGENHAIGESEPAATPRHEVFVRSFSIMRNPVTCEQARLLGWPAATWEEGNNGDPATNVSFVDSCNLARDLTILLRREGLLDDRSAVRVPTEAQWERAARGLDGRQFPWGEKFIFGRCNSVSAGLSRPSQVGIYSPNGDSPSGCADMAGNVREWTRTYAGASIRKGILYPLSTDSELYGVLADGRKQVIVRGGSFSYDDECVKTWVRNKEVAFQRRRDTGVRLVIDSV